jgi:hypothetical protein
MLEFAKSAVRVPWAMSVFGAQQVANVLMPRDFKQPTRQANATFYSVTQATEDQFNDLVWASFQVGDELQRDLVDLVFNILTFRAFTPRYVTRLSSDIAEQSAETLRVLTTGEGFRLAFQEGRNNFEVYNLVKHVHQLLNISPTGDLDLNDLLNKAYALGQYPDLWAVEGLGHDYADTFWGNRPIRNILSGARASGLPDKSLTMMHAGLGLSFAQHLMPTITPYSPVPEIRKVLQEFIGLVRDNARKGYEGAAYESLGLVTRTWHSQMMAIVDRLLSEIDQEVLSYFWHGAGRALYFLPIYVVPGFSSPWRAAEREAPHELGRRNQSAGLSWATALVNIRQPEILANLLRYRGGQLSKDDSFSNGVMSTITMANDTTPNDVYISAFLQYRPDSTDPHLVDLWNSLVIGPVEKALQRYYPVLKKHNRLGEVFHYQSLEQLVGRLGGV